MKHSICKVLFFILLTTTSCIQKKTPPIEKLNFNENWVFTINEKYGKDDSAFLEATNFTDWDSISIPHTPKIEPKIVNNQWQGISWYHKTFSLSSEMKDKKLLIKFEAAMNIAEVWVNNKKLIKHQGGYLPFVIDFTDVAVFGKKNKIHVKLNNNDNPVTGPKPLKTLDFNTYGGIYRNVWLISKSKLYITDPILENKTASGGVFVTYPKVSNKKATINIKTHVRNETEKTASFLIRNMLIKNDSIIVSVETEQHVLDTKLDQQISSNLSIENPELWSPKYPNLYHLKTEIVHNGNVIDSEITRIGIKTMKFVGQDFYLNGKKTFLRGVNRHQEYPFVGYALSDNANYRDAKKIKDAGFDYVRLSHYPQSKSFMNACDELGLVTIDAILGWQYFSEDKDFQDHVFQTAKDLIRRDRNHASVIAWEVSLNESWMPEPFIDSLIGIAKNEYPGNQCFTAGWQSYGYDIFLQARQHRLQHYDDTLKKPYNVSEYGDWEYYAMNAGLDQTSWSNLLQEERSSRQLRDAGENALLQQATNLQEAHNDNLNTPAFADGYWVMYDYNRGYADDLEASGIMNIFRVPKPSYYFYQSQRNAKDPFGEPMVYIANNWQKNSPLDVRIFSNCEEVELFLNGKNLGRQKPDQNRISKNLNHPPFTFFINKFEEGKLEAKGYIDGELVTSHTVQTPGIPSKIKIVIDTDIEHLQKEANDVFFVRAHVTDSNGTVIPNYSGKIRFKVDGDAELIGENPTNAIAGIASIVVKTSVNIKDIKITATAEGFLTSEPNSLKSETAFQKITVDSLPLIPKLFLKHHNNSNGFCVVRGDSSIKQVALTFDDGPTDVSLKIIELLNEHDAKGTFFWLGKNLNQKKSIIEEAKKHGNLIANHSWDHENGWELSADYIWNNQVLKSIEAFELNGAGKPKYYRPPFGAMTQEQIEYFATKGITSILWSITTMDWDTAQNTEEALFQKFKNQLHNGAIVLLHDFDFGNPEGQLRALENMLAYGKSIGFNFVSVEEII
jgi:beta-galactosidase